MRPLHFAANLTWRCQLRCPMCWIDDLGLDRTAPEHPWQDWRDAFSRFGANLLLDFSGGEPLLFPGFHKLALALSSAGVEWAVTSNMLEEWAVRQFLAVPVPGCVSWNLSWHAGAPARVGLLRQLAERGYRVAINAVLHPSEPLPTAEESKGIIVNWIPWQDWRQGDGTDGLPRICNAGQQHVVVDPTGEMYRCQVELQKKAPSLGNCFGTYRGWPSNHFCTVGCSACYTQNAMAAAGWRVAMEVAE